MEEETGIRLERALFAGVTNDVMPEDGKHYVDIIMMGVCKATDEAKNMEPSKCGALNVSGFRFRHRFYDGRGSGHWVVKAPASLCLRPEIADSTLRSGDPLHCP